MNKEVPPFTNLDIRVGRIVEVKPLKSNDRFYVEKVDVGNDEILEMVMEHQPWYAEEELMDRKVMVLCNEKTVKVEKVRSHGHILHATNSNGDIELVEPPEDAEIGDRLYADGEDVVEPVSAIHSKKMKLWDTISKELMTDSRRELLFKNRYKLLTKAGPVHVESFAKTAVA